MNKLILMFLFSLISISAVAASQDLPILHRVMKHTFQAPYSCGGDNTRSALFLSEYSKGRNIPDLLFNGACGAPLYIQANTAGDDFSLISDLGKVSLESVSASRAFNYLRTVGRDNSFIEKMPVRVGHTYVVLLAKGEIRALLAVRVDRIGQNREMEISYAVKSYAIQKTVVASPGFDWDAPNCSAANCPDLFKR